MHLNLWLAIVRESSLNDSNCKGLVYIVYNDASLHFPGLSYKAGLCVGVPALL